MLLPAAPTPGVAAIPGVSAEVPVTHAPDASPDTTLTESVAKDTEADTAEGPNLQRSILQVGI